MILKLQAILKDGSVALEFMTNDASEAAEMREPTLSKNGHQKRGIMRSLRAMGSFTYLSALLSIVLGLAITQVLSGSVVSY